MFVLYKGFWKPFEEVISLQTLRKITRKKTPSEFNSPIRSVMFWPLVIFTLTLCCALLVVYYLTFYNTYNDIEEKLTAFECGFDPLRKIRSPFSTRFFLLIVLFLIFDIEVALLFPVLTLITNNSPVWTISTLVAFLTILLFGIFHEWNEGALDWVTS